MEIGLSVTSHLCSIPPTPPVQNPYIRLNRRIHVVSWVCHTLLLPDKLCSTQNPVAGGKYKNGPGTFTIPTGINVIRCPPYYLIRSLYVYLSFCVQTFCLTPPFRVTKSLLYTPQFYFSSQTVLSVYRP